MSPNESPSIPESQSTPKADDLGFDLPQPAALSRTQVVAACTALVLVLGGVFAVTYLPRRSARAALEAGVKAAETTAPRVEVLTPKVTSSDRSLVLPGSIRPLEETVVYPRVSGYVRKWNVDIGDKVTEGQVLAEIDTPELDRELMQANAELTQAKAALVRAEASRDLSKSNLARYEKLVPAGVASQEDLEQRQGQARVDAASVTVAQASITAASANIQRTRDLKAFAKIVAPFAGTIVSRSVERGALVSAGNGTPLFRIAATDPVRVFVGVPQDIAPGVKVDAKAKVTVREFAGQNFEGTVARTSGALDAATRTMNTEVRVPNPDNKLLSGMYAEVSLTLPLPHRVLEVPATALYNDAKGLRVAVVDAENKIRFAPITVERDTGATILISTGLDGSERVVKLANVQLVEGTKVEILLPTPPQK
ncbi:efflux RND transporter periplasmic adaptor subunit [Polyangium jinanense]|uniref:Efflux RND transporter periplasmic adaptor subunit n=1 Tax=Polyangium jinanense TaxID=2829994 RepID=A0A9X3XBI5_9BACT|nr:efflux RND transporter periplasmic adaptor subunit [Polyangium jinanense]MDC3959859.1 efflux RND transporter periplasmic adaptor subunit [Polyangium jinanense]MDC3986310.1 efflux RND transporter periplasmic adaptor subunit [Polyangium jinanense]